MKTWGVAAAVMAVGLLAGCGNSNSEPTADGGANPTTSATPSQPPVRTPPQAQVYADAVDQRLAPCQGAAQSLSMECARAIPGTVSALREWYARLTTGAPSTRAEIQQDITKLEYWHDYCITSDANTPRRQACVKFVILPNMGNTIMLAFGEDTRRP